ncbi:tyrosine--tRNA ligase [Candidatus Kaiserbacteria bacterium RIFCSPHIGHO2_01_FULL_49_13]|uniref:Tyrosine--tRNA ligase n=1 Tax=Candidatus Kaiserbacteria bacterium RIFCSPHIGHO2_01_FULL_49_13 TaxID=1798477 RepID=A0A1F6CDP2_9BACT|nr:MAG: tyrosine--tRNA ligase [Candidatus Kaiserbacteria bacterium RIFCSPHIGHO2_01_FULL_49_13]
MEGGLAAELKERGIIAEAGGGTLEEILASPRKVYLGIDPTSDSLHVGHLVPLLLMKDLAEAGHEIFFIVGGGTGMIGDPRESGERGLLDKKTVASNTKKLRAQLSKIFGKKKYTILDNGAWLLKLGLVEFLRDIGKHFTVNQLIKRDIIKRRLADESDSISFTEFSYSLLQAYDYLTLYKKYGVNLQIGGSDQWTNIISGVDLIRRKEAASVYALTTPIIEDKKSGKKFGKSEGNAIWLDPKKTSAYEFYQFWLSVSDEGVAEYLKAFTFLSLKEIADLSAKQSGAPHLRSAQKKLAYEVTKTIHGVGAADISARISEILFGGASLSDLSKDDIKLLHQELKPTITPLNTAVIDVLVANGMVESKSEARRLVEARGVYLNDTPVDSPDRLFAASDFQNGLARLRRGKTMTLLARA